MIVEEGDAFDNTGSVDSAQLERSDRVRDVDDDGAVPADGDERLVCCRLDIACRRRQHDLAHHEGCEGIGDVHRLKLRSVVDHRRPVILRDRVDRAVRPGTVELRTILAGCGARCDEGDDSEDRPASHLGPLRLLVIIPRCADADAPITTSQAAVINSLGLRQRTSGSSLCGSQSYNQR